MYSLSNKMIIKVSSIIFVLMTIVFCSTSSDTVGASNSLLKYLVLFVGTTHLFYVYIKTSEKKLIFEKDLKLFLIFVLVLVIISLLYSIACGKISFRFVQEILFLVFPFLYSFLAINIVTDKELDKNMKISFIISFIFYLISLKLDFNMIIKNLFLVSWENSTSALESNIFCGYSLSYCMYFLYYDKSKIFKYLSLLFVFMTFKRPFILIALFMFIYSFFKSKNKLVNEKNVVVFTLLVFLLAFGYFQLMQPENVIKINNKYDINISKLTSTRSDRLRELYTSSFESYGFGSSTEYMFDYLYGTLEMDFVKMFIEVGIIPVIILIYTYLSISRYTRYTFGIMLFQLLNLIVTSSLTSCFAWMLIFLTIFRISKENVKTEEIYEKKDINNYASI